METRQPRIAAVGFGLHACLEMAAIALEDRLDIEPVAVDTEMEIDKATGEINAWHSKGFSIGVATSEGLVFARTLRREKIEEICRRSDLVFFLGDMSDSGVLDSFSEIKVVASGCRALTIGIFRLPDPGADIDRIQVIDERMQELRKTLDAWISVPYNPLLSQPEVYRLGKNVLRYGIKSIAEVVNVPGSIDVDMSDLRSVLKNAGPTYMSVGTGFGEGGWAHAALDVRSNGFLDISSPRGARSILLRIIGGYHLTLKMVNDIVDTIKPMAANDAKVIYGVTLDPIYNQATKITVIATGLPSYLGTVIGNLPRMNGEEK